MVADYPEGQGIFQDHVLADPAHQAIILFGCIERCGVEGLPGVIHDADTRLALKGQTRLLHTDRVCELGSHGNRVGAVDRDPDTGTANLQVWKF